MDRGLFFFLDQKHRKNIYSRSWELGAVINSLSSYFSKAHKAHCPKKDISCRGLIVFHFQKAAKHPDRIKVYWRVLKYENSGLFCSVQNTVWKLFTNIRGIKGKTICDLSVSPLREKVLLIKSVCSTKSWHLSNRSGEAVCFRHIAIIGLHLQTFTHAC